MRTLIAVAGMMSMLGFGVAAQTTEKAPTGQMCLLKVSGMHCGACAKAVENAAKKIDGVSAAKASQPKGTAEIAYDPAKTTPAAIARIISEKTLFKVEAAKADKK
jgi:copper chaperone CopZ